MEPILRLSNINKSFNTNQVLKSVSVAFEEGQVHAVVGENGAGKSTLMKIIGGIYERDDGEVFLDGEPVVFGSPLEAMQRGISIVHQELSLVDNLSVAQNVFSHREPANALGFIKWRELWERTRELFEQIGIEIDPRKPAGLLNVARQQLVEIAKAISMDARVIIMDEPTSSLSEQEVDYLYGIVNRLKERGVCVVFISHKLSEVFRIADVVTVLRDGQLIGTVETQSTDSSEIIRMMVGRHINDLYPEKRDEAGEPIMQVVNLGFEDEFRDISFDLRRGEILGLAGLVGAQRSESMLALFGAAPATSGELYIDGKKIEARQPIDAIRAGLCYLPEDRRTQGLFQAMSIGWNLTAASLNRVTTRRGAYDRDRIRRVAHEMIELLDIVPPDHEVSVQSLSGGNQQKVLLGKWLAAEPRVLIVDEPTRGVDVGAKSQIHLKLRELADSGIGIVVISSEQPEIVGLCDRVLVYCQGRITKELAGDEISQEAIVQHATH